MHGGARSCARYSGGRSALPSSTWGAGALGRGLSRAHSLICHRATQGHGAGEHAIATGSTTSWLLGTHRDQQRDSTVAAGSQLRIEKKLQLSTGESL